METKQPRLFFKLKMALILGGLAVTFFGWLMFNSAHHGVHELEDLFAAAGNIDPHIDEVREEIETGLLRDLVLLIGALVVSLLATFLVLKQSIFEPAKRLGDALQRMGQGDFSQNLSGINFGDFGDIATATQGIASELGGMVKGLQSSMNKINQSVASVGQITGKTKQGANQQRSETEQVASAVAELEATAKEVAGNAETAASATAEAKQQVKTVEAMVSDTLDSINALAREVGTSSSTIEQLQAVSDNIGSVLDVIGGIAEQTNLLALNAAIEAARAGEQGRGFAVVADEVRTLAQRTQASTSEIKQMIDNLQTEARRAVGVMQSSRTRAGETVEKSSAAQKAISTITTAVDQINTETSQIATAITQTRSVITEVSKNLTTIASLAESTAEDGNAATQEAANLHDISDQLSQEIKRFRFS